MMSVLALLEDLRREHLITQNTSSAAIDCTSVKRALHSDGQTHCKLPFEMFCIYVSACY